MGKSDAQRRETSPRVDNTERGGDVVVAGVGSNGKERRVKERNVAIRRQRGERGQRSRSRCR